MDRDSNCRNSQASCFRADKTAPQFQQSIYPAPNATVSQIEFIELRFSEELNNPKPSDFVISGPGKGTLYISSVEKTANYTYRLNMGSIGVGDGWIYVDFSAAKDYGGNTMAMPTQVQYLGNTQVQVRLTSQPAKMAISATGYNSAGMNFQFTHNYIDDDNNSWRACLTTGANSCPVGSPTIFASGTGLVSLDKTPPGTPQALSRAVANFSAGINRLVIVIENIGKNKTGINSWEIFHDSSAPSSTINPPGDPSATPLEVTFACSDNSDKIAYTTTSQQTTAPADPPDPTFDANGDPIAPAILYTGPFMTPSTPDPFLTKYRVRCIDRAGNVENLALAQTLYTIDTSIPTVAVNLDASYRSFISAVGANSTTLRFTTNQASPSQYKIVHGATTCAAGDGTQLIPPAPPGGLIALPATPGELIQHTFDTTTHFTADGVYNVRICVRNVSAVWGSAYLQITRDSALPTTTASPTGGNFGADQFVALTCNDTNPDKIAYTINSGATDPSFFPNGDVNFGFTATGPILVSQGVTTIKYLCRDKAGNIQFTPGSQTYTIDKILPTITVVSNTYAALSTTGSQTATSISWTSSRPSAPYVVRIGGADCTLGTLHSSGTTNADTNVPVVTNLAVGSLGADGPYTIRLCVENAIGTYGNTTVAIQKDSVAPDVPNKAATLTTVDATHFTLNGPLPSDAAPSSGIVGYRIYRSGTSGSYTNYPATPTYTAITLPATIAVPDTNPYYLKIVPFDAAGNLTTLASAYDEVATKPEIRLVVSGLSGAFDITDGTASLNVTGNITAPGNIWSTTLASGQTYNFNITTQPTGQVCAIKERQFGTFSSVLAINVNCVTGYQVGGQNLNTVPAAKLAYRLYQGRNLAIAGSGTPGGTDAAGASASFNFPEYLTHLNGNLYVSDTNTFKIRRIALTGNVVTSLTGTGSNGTGTIADDGLCGSAALGQPMGITTDGTNIYVAEINYGRIRKISDINGTCRVMTLVGTGVSGYAEGAANVAQFNQPRQIVANNSHIYVADSINNRIRRISLSTGVVDTLIGNGAATDANGTGTAASISAPIGLALINTMLYASTAQHRIMSIDINSQVATIVAGDGTASYTDASGLTARFNQIYSITTDGVDLYTAEIANHVIRRVDVANNFRVTTLAGLPAVTGDVTNANGVAARFNLPHGIATDGRSLFIANHTGHTIRKLIDNGLVAYWPLNGSLADHSSAGSFNKAGTITGTVTATTGRFGEANGAYYFDGAQSSIGTPGGTQADTNFNTGNFTVAFWVKPALTQQETSVNKDYDIISNWGTQYDFAIRYHNEVSSGVTIPPNIPGQMIFIRFDGTTSAYCTSGIRIDDSKFHHIAAQKSGGTLSMYIDGKKVCVASDTVGSITSVGPPRIGARDGGISNDFTGALADMRIYARALNEGEINELAQDAGGTAEVGNGYSTAGTGLLAHYQFNGATPTPSGPLGGNLSGGASLYAGKDGDASGALYYDTVPASFLTGADYGLPVANAPRSLCGWFYPMSHPSTGHTNILSYGNAGAATNGQGLAIEVDSGKVKVSYHFGGGQSRFADWTPPLNTWTHFCGTYDGSTILMYVNGVALPQTGSTFTPPLTTTTVGATGLGIGVWGGASKFNGKLDDLRIYNNALSAIAVRQLATQVPIGLVARYDFSGDTKDVSGFGNDLTNGGANSSSDRFGISGGAYHFNGTSNVMSNTSTALPFPVNTANRTMCFWGRADQALGGVRIGVAYGNSSTNQAAQIGVNNLDTTGPSTLGCAYGAPCSPGGFIAQNTWYNICMVVSGSSAQIYLNGGAAGSAVSAAAWTTTRGPISIGSYSSNYWFPGDIDEVLIYNRALSANEIRTLTGHRPQQVSGWSVNNAATSLKFHLQPESATYANGSCFGGANCVSAWRDTSGLNNHLAQAAVSNRPVYDAVGINFRPALRFVDTASTFVTGTCSGDLNSQAMTVLAVLKEVSQGGNDGIFQNGGPGNGKLIYLLDSPARPALFDLQANQLNFQPTGATAYNASSESVLMSFDYVFTNPSASGNFYKNGASVASAVSTATGSYNCGAGTLDMGRYFWGAGGDYYDGYMGDFLYFNGVLSNADRQVAECYLSAKYNVSVGAICP